MGRVGLRGEGSGTSGVTWEWDEWGYVGRGTGRVEGGMGRVELRGKFREIKLHARTTRCILSQYLPHAQESAPIQSEFFGERVLHSQLIEHLVGEVLRPFLQFPLGRRRHRRKPGLTAGLPLLTLAVDLARDRHVLVQEPMLEIAGGERACTCPGRPNV